MTNQIPSKNKLLAKNLGKKYGDRLVVDDVSIEVNCGEIVGLLGPNGAGKTTTFYMIMGLIEHDVGSILLNNKRIDTLPMYKRARFGMGYLPQEDSIFRKLTVIENLVAVAEYLKISSEERFDRIKKALNEMELTKIKNQKAYTLSGGERKRLEIARTLVMRPRFLLMDEPFSGVDPISVNDLQTIMLSLKQKDIGILITDHNVRETLKIVDRAYLIYDGKILCHGTGEKLLNDEKSRKFYFGENFTI